jgi:alpha-D-ribose 1-methylphosphonate 5-triphosphate diphosphatase
MEAAQAAIAHGMNVTVGAPNVLRDGSLTGNLNAREAVLEGFANMICSDYSPMSLLHAGIALHRLGAKSLVEVSNLLSAVPAESVGLAQDTGTIEEGKLADLVLVDCDAEVPAVKKTYVAGREVYSSL